MKGMDSCQKTLGFDSDCSIYRLFQMTVDQHCGEP